MIKIRELKDKSESKDKIDVGQVETLRSKLLKQLDGKFLIDLKDGELKLKETPDNKSEQKMIEIIDRTLKAGEGPLWYNFK